MISKEIFQQYFKRKLIIWVSIGIAATLIRLLAGHETTFVLAVTINLFFVAIPLIIGYIDYNFYEKSAPKIISRLINKEPLSSFQNIGFTEQEGNKLSGQINNYKIILSPLTNLEGDKNLIVLIPLKIKEGLENYFTKYNDSFIFTLSDEIIFAEAIIKNYDKEYTYNKLFDLISNTTLSLRENRIEQANIVDV